MKRFKTLLLAILLIPCVLLLNACTFFGEEEVYITDIVQTDEADNVATYTIYYSNGETALFTVENGKDGKDGNSPEIMDIYNLYVAKYGNITYQEFLEKYLTIKQDSLSVANAVQEATNIALKSAITICCEFPTSNSDGSNKQITTAYGAGVIYKVEETYSFIITNYHVVYMKDCDTDDDIAKEIHIFQYGTSEEVYKKVDNSSGTPKVITDAEGYPDLEYGYGAISATYVGGEMTYDLAVLKVPTAELRKYYAEFDPVTVAETYELAETAIAIGNPEAEGFSVTSGIISVVSEEIEMLGPDDETECEFRVMRIDTAVNGGNSGGGLFNLDGKWIGIVNAKAVSADIDNIAYAIPFDNVTAVVDNILHYYNGTNPSGVKKLVLGISYRPENSHAVYNPDTNRTIIVDDLEVKSVDETSVAKIIGLHEGDIIKSISINGVEHTLTRAYQLGDFLLTVRAEDNIIFTVSRSTGTKQLSKTILESYLQEV